eukprot:1696041-Rhodomonas_salina.2
MIESNAGSERGTPSNLSPGRPGVLPTGVFGSGTTSAAQPLRLSHAEARSERPIQPPHVWPTAAVYAFGSRQSPSVMLPTGRCSPEASRGLREHSQQQPAASEPPGKRSSLEAASQRHSTQGARARAATDPEERGSQRVISSWVWASMSTGTRKVSTLPAKLGAPPLLTAVQMAGCAPGTPPCGCRSSSRHVYVTGAPA